MKPSLYICCNAGLSNRLHAIAGAQLIAKATGRELKVWWPSNEHLTGQFKRFFKNELAFVRQAEIEALLSAENRVRVYNCGFEPARTTTDECFHVMADDPEEIVLIKSWWIPRMNNLRSQRTIMPHVVRFLRELEPVDEIMEQVNSCWRAVVKAGQPTIGLHLRYGDVVPGTTKWDEAIVKLYSKSGVGEFSRILNRIGQVTTNVNFWFASNNPATMSEIDAGIPLMMRSQGGEIFGRDTVYGIRQGIVDLYVLSRCKFVIGSHYSQYSQLAAELGCVPLVIAGSPNCDEQITKLLKTI